MTETELPMEALEALWIEHKRQETEAKENRLRIEQKIVGLLDKGDAHIGTEKGEKISVTYKMQTAVDRAALLKVALASRISNERLGQLFRWKPEIDAKAWKEATPEEKKALQKAFVTKPSKPAFKANK